MLDRRAVLRVFIGFILAIVFWSAFSKPYERVVARSAELVLRAFERPAVTRLEAVSPGFRIERRDFPPGSPRPVLPAADLHFNFVLLVSLFALDPRPWESQRVARLLVAVALLFVVHVAALAIQVQSVYATALGPWSAARYGAVARNFWGGAFHFYQVAGRFAAPFAIWWPLRRTERTEEKDVSRAPVRRRKKRRRQ
ncbi:MAG: hypothetical protein ABR576_10590 [Thermoanaerobaculia bacterium]